MVTRSTENSSQFQSTHSLRSATPVYQVIFPGVKVFQSTHSLRSATNRYTHNYSTTVQFQSTHSLRSATYVSEYSAPGYDVSIHALLAECDIHTSLQA